MAFRDIPMPPPSGTVAHGEAAGSEPVRLKEREAQLTAHLLDDLFRVPGTSLRIGLDPLFGLVPVIGDVLTTAAGAAILLNARQLQVPKTVLARMAYNVLLNGVIGAVPGFGDVFSFWFKSHSKNAALLMRTVAQGHEGACPMVVPPTTAADLGMVAGIVTPIALLAGWVGYWFWDRGVTVF
jgi:hypothetical protein